MQIISSRFGRIFAIFMTIAFMGASFAAAQTGEGEITGTITDSAGQLISGASVQIRNEGTNVSRVTKTGRSGVYAVPGLVAGKYSVDVSKPGFVTLHRSGIEVFVATSVRLDVALSVGSRTQTVTVNANANMLQPNNAQMSTEITRQQYNDLPLVQQGRIRSPTSFVYLAPSVQGNYTPTGKENTAATNYISVNGSQMKSTQFYLNGLPAGQAANVGSYTESAPPVDAIQEFKMITTMLPAQYGHTGSAAGIFAVRNGTNHWHGSVYEHFRNDALDAEPWGAIAPLVTRQNEFGATIGGPIVLPRYNGRNHSFFFFSYGGSRKSGLDTLTRGQVPTPAQILGDFTGFHSIYDPATTRLNSSGTGFIRDPFPQNKIPGSRINPTAAKIASFYPAPNIEGTKNFENYTGEKLLNEDVYTGRVDLNPSESQHLYFTGLTTRIPRLLIQGSGLPEPLSSIYNQFLRTITTRINDDWTLSPSMMNSLAIGYYRLTTHYPAPGTEFSIPGQLSPNRPKITFSNGYASISTDFGTENAHHQYMVSDIFYWLKGAQNFRFGGSYRRVHYNLFTPNPASTSLSFSNLETADPGNSGKTGDGFASFLLGQVGSGSVEAPFQKSIRYTIAGLFFEDNWKVAPRLNLNLGIRWEFETIPYEAQNRSSIVSLTTPNPDAGNLPGAVIFAGSGPGRSGMQSFAKTRYTGLSPRLGLTYMLAHNLVVRSGFGLYYMDLGWSTSAGHPIETYGFSTQASFSSPDHGITPAFTIESGIPGSPSLKPTFSPGIENGQSPFYLPPDIGYMPYIEQWSLGFQYSPSPSWMVELTYVGNQSHRLENDYFANINQVDPKYLALGSLLNVPADSPAAQAAGIKIPYPGFKGSVAQALRPYPQYKTLNASAAKTGYANYNSGQVVVRKRMGNGLFLSASYVFSKNLGINSPHWMDSTENNVLQNAYDPSAEYSISPIDVQQALVLDYTYELPFGRGKRFLNRTSFVKTLAGGWRVSAIQRYQSGFPLPIVTSNDLPIGNRTLRPNVVPGVSRSTHLSVGEFQPATSRIVNPAAFSQPEPYTFGDARPTYSDVRSFPIFAEDLSVSKQTHLTEDLVLHFGASFFNAFNRHRFTNFVLNYSDISFGKSTSVSLPRYIQFNTRLQF